MAEHGLTIVSGRSASRPCQRADPAAVAAAHRSALAGDRPAAAPAQPGSPDGGVDGHHGDAAPADDASADDTPREVKDAAEALIAIAIETSSTPLETSILLGP